MEDYFICPYCGGYMDYTGPDDSLICIVCHYMLRGDGTEDFSLMELEID